MTKRLLLLICALAALAIPAAAVAASISDLQALGYSVSVSSELPGPTKGSVCKVYYISGKGIGIYANECDSGFQATLNSIANPPADCNRQWQNDHPDQLAALQAISSKGYNVSGDQCADSFTVTNGATGATVWSGSGAGLPGLNATLGQAAAAPTTTTTDTSGGGSTTSTTGAPAPTVTGTCLPLCPTPDTTRDGAVVIPVPAGTTIVPTAIPVVSVTPLAPAQQQSLTSAVTAAVTPADPAGTTLDPTTFTIVAASQEIQDTTDVVGWINSPYVTLALAEPAA